MGCIVYIVSMIAVWMRRLKKCPKEWQAINVSSWFAMKKIVVSVQRFVRDTSQPWKPGGYCRGNVSRCTNGPAQSGRSHSPCCRRGPRLHQRQSFVPRENPRDNSAAPIYGPQYPLAVNKNCQRLVACCRYPMLITPFQKKLCKPLTSIIFISVIECPTTCLLN